MSLSAPDTRVSADQQEGGGPSVAICVATYRRPEGLRALLESLNALRVPDPAPDLRIIVVDNDPAHPATAVLGDVTALSRWPLKYAFEQVAGLVTARNRLLELVPPATTFVAFLDDDGIATSGWLEAMMLTHRRTRATVVQGPVLPIFLAVPPPWIEATRLFELGPFREGESLAYASTSNVMIRKAFLDDHELCFDMRFNSTGGEDQELFTRLQGLGGTIVASAGAVIHEQVPDSRLKLTWALRRSHRIGNTLGRIALIRRHGLVVRLCKGVGATLAGAARLSTIGLLSPNHRVRGLLEIARGSGMLTAFLGVAYAGYSAEAVARDRGEIG